MVDEFDTLVNPQRDVGPVRVHGITASMVEAAPTFEEVAVALSTRISGSLLVAHNLAFDVRMLAREYGRLGAELQPGAGICTLQLTGERLPQACQRHGVEHGEHHRALADARAAASLALCAIDGEIDGAPASVDGLSDEMRVRTLRRSVTSSCEPSPLRRAVGSSRFPSSDDAVLSYLDMLDWALDDLVLTRGERSQLQALAVEVGLQPQQVRDAHDAYLRSLVAAAMRDGIITGAEHEMMTSVAQALGLESVPIPPVTQPREAAVLEPGMRICFTGDAVLDGCRWDRAELESVAATLGLQPVRSVTKKNCDLLVAADPSTQSGKANKARQYGKPIMALEEFVAAAGVR